MGASECVMEAEGEGWRRGADKKRRTNDRGWKDKRGEAVYNVLLRAQQNTERGGVSVSQKIIAFYCRSKQSSRLGFFFLCHLGKY